MRICRIAKRFPPLVGGLEFHVRDLSVQQARNGNEVEIFILFGDPVMRVEGVKVYKVPGGRLVERFRKDSLVSMAYLGLCLWPVVRAHRRQAFDLVHVHGDMFEALLGGLLGRVLDIPSVITIHAGLNTKRMYRRLARHLFQWVGGIIAHSEDIRQEVMSLGIGPDKITVCQSGIWYERFKTRSATNEDNDGLRKKDLGASPGELVVLAVGRLHAMKGLEYLIEATKSLVSDVPLRLIIIGDGPERQRLARLAASSGERVCLIGEKAHDELSNLLKVGDIFALPSVSLPGQRESTPTALMEAMAAGLPIVATPTGGIKQHIEDGINGFLVPERDAGALAKAIGNLCQHKALRHRMGQENHQRARAFDWSHIAAQVAESYKRAARR